MRLRQVANLHREPWSGPGYWALIQYPFWWMGVLAVRVIIVHVKPEGRAGNPPSSPQRKTRRGCRGTRKNSSRKRSVERARGSQPRRTSNRGPIPSNGQGGQAGVSPRPGGQLMRRRLRRRNWIEKRFEFLEKFVKLDPDPGHGMGLSIPSRGRLSGALRGLNWTLTMKRYPLPPGKSIWDWFLAYLEMRHGTWQWVSEHLADTPLGGSGHSGYDPSVGCISAGRLKKELDNQSLLSSGRRLEAAKRRRDEARLRHRARAPGPVRHDDGTQASRTERTAFLLALKQRRATSSLN
jgi:hypothetical protein